MLSKIREIIESFKEYLEFKWKQIFYIWRNFFLLWFIHFFFCIRMPYLSSHLLSRTTQSSIFSIPNTTNIMFTSLEDLLSW